MFTSSPSWQLLLTAAAYCLLLWVIWNGQLRHSRFATPVAGTVVGLFVGLLFKVQHWLGYSELLVGSGTVLAGLYGLWFARKLSKTRLDFLKLSYALSLGVWALAQGLGWRPAPAAVAKQLAADEPMGRGARFCLRALHTPTSWHRYAINRLTGAELAVLPPLPGPRG